MSVNWFDSKSHAELRDAQHNDPILKQVINWIENGNKPKWADISHLSQTLKTYWSQFDRLVLNDEILYRKWVLDTSGNDTNFQYVLPNVYRNQVLSLLHNDPLAGHLGIKRTMARVRCRFYWAGYNLTVERWCKRCKECQKRHQPDKKSKGQMKTYVIGEPLERISLDILGPVTRSYNGNKYILVVTDYFTRFAEAYSLQDIEASTVADKLLTEFICRYGVPQQIHTDQGSQFTSD